MHRTAKRLYQYIADRRDRLNFSVTPSKDIINSAAVLTLAISALVFFIWNFDTFFNSIGPLYFFIYTFLFILLTALAATIFSYMIKVSALIPPLYRVAVLFTFFMVSYVFYLDKAYGGFLIVVLLLFPSLLGGGLRVMKKHGWSILTSKKYVLTSLAIIIGIAGLIYIAIWLIQPGQKVKSPVNAALLGSQPPFLSDINDPSSPGKYEVQFVTYGSGKDKYRNEYGKGVNIVTTPVDGSFLLSSWAGFSGKLRTAYFGFDNTALPLNSRVWYPKGNGPFPLVLITHGNHLAQDYSDGGYEYLGKLLASRGYIVCSVDENFLNGSFTDLNIKNIRQDGLKNENAARAWLLLKHLQVWENWNKSRSSKFFNRVDMDRIALIGHSRGGEAVGLAAFFNKLPYFPDDATEAFDFNFNIRSVIAIAPTDGQYRPGDMLVQLTDINYLALQGMHDMQDLSYEGMRTFYRIKFSPDFEGFKAGLYIHHANHGQFNSSWGRKDRSSPYINKYNLEQVMKEEDQQKIAKVYFSAFLDATLKGAVAYKPLFWDHRVGRHWLPNEIYLNQFQAGGGTSLATYDEDLDLSTTTLQEGHIDSKNLSIWRERQNSLIPHDQSSRSVYIGWNHKDIDTLIGSYTLTLPDSTGPTVENRLLTFSLAEGNESSGHRKRTDKKQNGKVLDEDKDQKRGHIENKRPIDFSIELVDKQGNKLRFLLSTCSYLQPRIKKTITKFAFLERPDDSEGILDFFYFNLSQIASRNPDFKLTELKKIRFVFDQTPEGVIILDDIGLM